MRLVETRVDEGGSERSGERITVPVKEVTGIEEWATIEEDGIATDFLVEKEDRDDVREDSFVDKEDVAEEEEEGETEEEGEDMAGKRDGTEDGEATADGTREEGIWDVDAKEETVNSTTTKMHTLT